MSSIYIIYDYYQLLASTYHEKQGGDFLAKKVIFIAEKIKALREQAGMTQTELARRLGITRSSVNGWEMGLALPATTTLVDLAKILHVSTDYLLGLKENVILRTDNLTPKEISILSNLISYFQEKRESV